MASWPEALDAAARGLTAARDARGVGVLVGGRVTAEDAYAYGKFARVALQHQRHRLPRPPALGGGGGVPRRHVVGTGPEGDAVTYADLERARTVVLVGFEPEDESPIVFLRLRKAFRKNKTAVYAVAPFATRGLDKVGGTLIQSAPGTEAEVLAALADGTHDGSHPGVAAAAAGPGR